MTGCRVDEFCIDKTVKQCNNKGVTSVNSCSVSVGVEKMGNMLKEVFSVEETAKILGISRGLLYKIIYSGELKSFKVGSRRLITKAALNEYISSAE